MTTAAVGTIAAVTGIAPGTETGIATAPAVTQSGGNGAAAGGGGKGGSGAATPKASATTRGQAAGSN